jgi:hypothetical protein
LQTEQKVVGQGEGDRLASSVPSNKPADKSQLPGICQLQLVVPNLLRVKKEERGKMQVCSWQLIKWFLLCFGMWDDSQDIVALKTYSLYLTFQASSL